MEYRGTLFHYANKNFECDSSDMKNYMIRLFEETSIENVNFPNLMELFEEYNLEEDTEKIELEILNYDYNYYEDDIVNIWIKYLDREILPREHIRIFMKANTEQAIQICKKTYFWKKDFVKCFRKDIAKIFDALNLTPDEAWEIFTEYYHERRHDLYDAGLAKYIPKEHKLKSRETISAQN